MREACRCEIFISTRRYAGTEHGEGGVARREENPKRGGRRVLSLTAVTSRCATAACRVCYTAVSPRTRRSGVSSFSVCLCSRISSGRTVLTPRVPPTAFKRAYGTTFRSTARRAGATTGAACCAGGISRKAATEPS